MLYRRRPNANGHALEIQYHRIISAYYRTVRIEFTLSGRLLSTTRARFASCPRASRFDVALIGFGSRTLLSILGSLAADARAERTYPVHRRSCVTRVGVWVTRPRSGRTILLLDARPTRFSIRLVFARLAPDLPTC